MYVLRWIIIRLILFTDGMFQSKFPFKDNKVLPYLTLLKTNLLCVYQSMHTRFGT